MTAKQYRPPEFLRISMEPYRHGGPENALVINTRCVESVAPPSTPGGRYWVNFKRSGVMSEYGMAEASDLIAAGIRLPRV